MCVVKSLFVEIFPTSICQCGLFSKKNPIIQIVCTSGRLTVPINLDKWSSTVFTPLLLKAPSSGISGRVNGNMYQPFA